jgi:hypothetical protein
MTVQNTAAADDKRFLKFEKHNTSHSVCDLTENLLDDEEKSAKKTLENLWNLKSRLTNKPGIQTVEMLIEYYQNKIDLLRDKRITLLDINEKSKNLLTEKYKSEEQLSHIGSIIKKCDDGITTLEKKRTELIKKQRELAEKKDDIDTRLNENNSLVIAGLYESVRPDEVHTQKDSVPHDAVPENIQAPDESYDILFDDVTHRQRRIPFPLIAIKNESGRLISQYYVKSRNSQDIKIFNCIFFSTRIKNLAQEPHNRSLKNIVLLCIKDTQNRIAHNSDYEYDKSLNEIINNKNLCLLYEAIQKSDFALVSEFSKKLKSKINSLGNNYKERLEEQLNRTY